VLADDPDIEVNVADNKKFVRLHTSESWITTVRLDAGLWKFPNDIRSKDVFRFVFDGATVDLWQRRSKNVADLK